MLVVDLTDEYLPFVSRCTHIDVVNEEHERVIGVRESWLRNTPGLKVKVAVDDGAPLGFAHCLPIEAGTWGMSGHDVMAVPCLTLAYKSVYQQKHGSGVGRALVEAVEAEARSERKKGVAVLAYDNDFWFMPARFFARLGYEEVARQGSAVIMQKAFEPVQPPVMHQMRYQPRLVAGKVVVDAFWNPMCLTSIIEIQRVRDVCAESGDAVVLQEYNCGDKGVLETYQTSRALFINGKPIGWGYEAPRAGLRSEIEQALRSRE